MLVLLNRTQLAREMRIAPETLRAKIKLGKIKAFAEDGNGRELFKHPKTTAQASTKGNHVGPTKRRKVQTQ